MLVNRIIFSVLCAGALVVGEARAGQSAEESQATQPPSLKRFVYSVDDLLKALSISDPKPGQNPAEKLIRLITSSIAPETWAEVGGTGTIQYYPLGKALIVNQTQDNQEQIVDFLVALRKLKEAQEVEVLVEARIMEMSPAMAKTFMSIAGFSAPDSEAPPSANGLAFLNERQVNGWLELFQGDRSFNIMQAPKITGFDGQQLEIKIGDEITFEGQEDTFFGLHGKFLPVVSADHHFVKLNIEWNQTWLEGHLPNASPQKAKWEKVIVLPSGGTAVCHLLKHNDEECETAGPPVLSKIPYLSRLFTNVGHRTEGSHLFLMVTTRVIANEGNKAAAVDGDCALPRIPR